MHRRCGGGFLGFWHSVSIRYDAGRAQDVDSAVDGIRWGNGVREG